MSNVTSHQTTNFLSVEAAYDRWAEGYDGADNPMVFAARRVLSELDEVAGADVVEYGCGTGENLAALKSRGARSLIGLDLSQGMLAEARRRDPSFTLFRHDIHEPAPLPPGCADLVLFCLSLEHVAHVAVPIAHGARLLRRGGRIVVIEIHPELSAKGVGAHFEDEKGRVHMPTFRHTLEVYERALSAAGLQVVTRRGWRARELGDKAQVKVFKRGADAFLALEIRASASEDIL